MALAKSKNRRTVLKSFRIPREIDEILAGDAKEEGRTLTELHNSLLARYVSFDRFARKFGFVTLSRGTFKAIIDALPEDKLRELAISQSSRIEELVIFWFKKKDLDAVMAAIDLFSRHLHMFEYTTSRSDGELVVTMRTDLGKKAALFASLYWERGIARVLGATPKVEVSNDQVTLKLALKAERT